jgi:hypothetical protein
MNRVILNLAVALTILTSCNKNKTCNCGTIANDGVDYNNGNSCYWLEIRNTCSDNKKKFCFDQDVWMDANVGEDFCVYNQGSW